MSAQIPARRTRQAIRPPSDENAARGAIPRTTRTKITGPFGVAGGSNQNLEKAATSVKADPGLTKRKREALGEVTNKSKLKGALGDGKGLTVEKDSIAVKKSLPTTSTSVTGARVPLGERRVGGTNATSTVALRKTKIAVQEKVDLETLPVEPAPMRGSRRISTRTTTSTTNQNQTTVGLVRASSTSAALTSRRPVVASHSTLSTTAGHARGRSLGTRRPLGATQVRDVDYVEEDLAKPAQKKRRTSSLGPEEHTQAQTEVAPYDESSIPLPKDEDQGALAEDEVELEGLGSLEGEKGWEDLDKEDAGDPLMVSEYVNEIFQYLLRLEVETMPNPKYMDTQAELAWRMRGILTDWLIQIHGRFRLLPETLFLTINIIDRFLSSRVVSLVKLQLVGVTSMFIAAKYEEIMAPSVANFLASADGNYGEKDILDAEKYILRTLDWNMSYPNPIHYLRRASKADGYDLAVRTVAKYFIEMSCLEHRLLECRSSQIAAAGIWLARLVLDKEDWTPNLVHYSGYSEAELVPVARIMLNYVLKPSKHENFFKKYAARKFMKASPFVYSWARDRWPEGTNVDLAEELPELKRAAKIRRETGQGAGMLAEERGVLIG